VIVIDASALMEVLLATGVGARVRARLFREEETLHAPHLRNLKPVRSWRHIGHNVDALIIGLAGIPHACHVVYD
jgi:hypothetical protein